MINQPPNLPKIRVPTATQPGMIGRIASWWLERKGYSLVPVGAQSSGTLRAQPRPSDEQLLRAYGESPWLHLKVIRQANAVAKLQPTLMADMGGPDLVPVAKTHAMWSLIRRPNPHMGRWTFTFLTEIYCRTVGGLWWRFKRDGLGVPRQLWLYPTHWVQARRKDPRTGEVIDYALRTTVTGGKEEIAPARDMLRLWIPDPVSPYDRQLGDALAIATELDTMELSSESNRRFFQNDASPPGALVVPGRPNPGEIDRLRDDWQAKQGGPDRQGQTGVLYGGMDYKQFRVSNRDMEFIDGQRYLRDVIVGGVHKHILGISDDVTFANAKAADYTHATQEIDPRMPWYEEEAWLPVCLQFDPRLRVQMPNPVPEDEAFELQRFTAGLNAGTVLVDEWREQNGMEPLPDGQGQILYVPASSVPQPINGANPPRPGPVAGQQASSSPPDGLPSIEAKALPTPVPGSASTIKQLNAADVLDILASISDDVMREELKPIYLRIMGARLQSVARELGISVVLDQQDPRVVQYLRTVSGQRITRINEATRNKIRDALAEGAQAGEGVTGLAERIADVFEAARGARAMTIARTETIDASNAVARWSYERSGVVEKIEWLLAPDYDPNQDGGVCEDIANDGPVLVGESFKGSIPWPPAHPNCRCTVAPIVEGDEEKGIRAFRWMGEEREKHITALGREHAKWERIFVARMKRIFQAQQRDTIRALRSALS